MNGQTIRVFGKHLSLSSLGRRRQAAAIIAYAGQQEGLPTVLIGDLNEWSAKGGCLRDFAHHLQFAECGKSSHSRRPVATLDGTMPCYKRYAQNSGVTYRPRSPKDPNQTRSVGEGCVSPGT